MNPIVPSELVGQFTTSTDKSNNFETAIFDFMLSAFTEDDTSSVYKNITIMFLAEYIISFLTEDYFPQGYCLSDDKTVLSKMCDHESSVMKALRVIRKFVLEIYQLLIIMFIYVIIITCSPKR